MTEERDTKIESGQAEIDEEGRNPTQQRMDDEGVEPAPVDASWEGENETGPATALSAQAEGSVPSGPADSPGAASGSANEPIFEPDVPLVAEVNREATPKSRKGLVAAVAGGFALVGAALLRRRR
jgi:hypothetical protein